VTEKTLVPANEEESENQGWSAKQKRCGEPTRRLNCWDEFHPVSDLMDADRPWKEDLRTLTRQLTGPTSVNDGEQWSSSV
jgi:hypothetical protein